MEFFLPSVFVLLLAAAVVFFVFPRFGPLTLAIVSLALLVLGVYNHASSFGAEYRLSTWQLALANYPPYVMIGGLLLAIIGYLLFLAPSGSAVIAPVNIPTVANMPPPETATNALTATVNRGLNAAANLVGANNKRNNASANASANAGLFGNILGNNKRNAGNGSNANRSAGPFSLV